MKGRSSKKPIPYVSFTTFLAALENLKGARLGNVVIRERCGDLSDSGWEQLCRAFRALQLFDKQDTPTALLKSLLKKDRKLILLEILKQHYPEAFAANLKSMRRSRLDEILTTNYGITGETVDKARSFLLGAVRYCELDVSPELRGIIRHRTGRKRSILKTETQGSKRRFQTIEPILSENKILSETSNDMTLTIAFRRGSLPEIEETEHELIAHLFGELRSFIKRAKGKNRHLTSIKP